MSTPNIVQNLGQGDMPNVNRGMSNLGKPVMNNQGTPSLGTDGRGIGIVPNPGQPVSPILQQGGGIMPPAGMIPGGSPSPLNPQLTNIIGSNGGIIPQQAQATGGTLLPSPGGVGVVPSSTGTPNSPLSNQTPQQAQQLLKQLKDTYGKGTGGLLDSLINSIGGNDDAYLAAYQQAMAGPNAENLATLNTTLGNSGISMDSSTAAIANADFQANVTSQEGLQAQQLKMNDLAQLQSLVQGLQGGSAAEVSSGGFLNDFASIMGSIGSIIPGASGASGRSANLGGQNAQAASGIGGQGMINYESQPLGEGAIPLGTTDTSSLPGISEEPIIGADVFI